MKELNIFSQNALACNSYIYVLGKIALVIETSGQITQIIDEIKQKKITKVILAYTHGHFDHIAYGESFQQKIREANIELETFAPSKDREYFEENGQVILEQSLRMFGASDFYPQAQIPHIQTYIEDGDPLPFLDFICIETPGHSPGSCCFYSAEKKIMFSGDTIFADGGTGRTDLPGGCAQELVTSLKKLSLFPHDTQILPGHGPQDTLGHSIKLAL
ncbi:MAG: MBL fold metallo-hydrolase [Spirochaetia bacterium]